MARSLSLAVRNHLSCSLSPRLFSLRAQSSHPLTHLTDVDSLDSSSDDSPDPDHLVAFRRIEDAVHSIIARRSAPDWLPFSPGSSYWVPSPKNTSRSVAELVGKLTMGDVNPNEQVSLGTRERVWPSKSYFIRGGTRERVWPSKSYFIRGAFPHQVEAEANSSNVPHPEDEEG